MKYSVYLIISKINQRFFTYVGYTNNINKRLSLHNSSKGAKFTKGKFWKLVYQKNFNTKSEALKYEFKLKNNRVKRNNLKNYIY
jgi:Predicted endonuclease containing a URI domain